MNLLDINQISGLTELTATQRQQQEGYNELPASQHHSIWAIAWEVVQDPIFLLLLACGLIYLSLGDIQEAIILLGFVLFMAGIGLYQETKTERALEALRDLSSPRALVIRDGQQRRIPGREVVRGDILMLAEGDRVPADAVLITANHLSCDESLLTGESLPVSKIANSGGPSSGPSSDSNRLPYVYSGTLVVQGQGIAEVLATGSHTEIGKIGKALQSLQPEATRLQQEIANLVRNLAIVGLSLCGVIIVVYGLTRGDWLKGLLAGITLAMAILPNEFPVVVTIFLALGAWRISQKQVLTRRVPAIETLGSATVLCVDKTGTLTLNQMAVQQLAAVQTDQTFVHYDLNRAPLKPLPENVHELVEFSILASQKNPFDPMEKALRELGNHYLRRTEHLHDDWSLLQEYPLSPTLMAMSQVWQSADSRTYMNPSH